MQRILLLYPREWRHPQGDDVSRYVFEVFSRIAAHGYQITWLTHRHMTWRAPRPAPVESLDGIRIARIGMRCLYPLMAGLFLKRWVRSTGPQHRFDLIVDCITRYPLDRLETGGAPILPLVFGGHLDARYVASHHGPFVAAGTKAEDLLHNAGVAENLIIRAPGIARQDGAPEWGTWDETAGLILAVIEILGTRLALAS